MPYSPITWSQLFPPVGELTIFFGSMVGASLGFLWYNSHPAEIFMGDVGSLALGGAMGTVSVIIKQELLLVFVGGVFVIEARRCDPGCFVQVQGKADFQDVAVAPPLRIDRLERAEDHYPVSHPVVHLCTVQSDDIEVEVMVWLPMDSRCFGRRVVVVGAARSGVAAARCGEGANVTLTETRQRSTRPKGCARSA